ncbi:bifunctional RecB family nuclease/DEAD/DEAH box helicase [Diaminobutyricimonas sp. TR449]|uniref:TM0106 family RecB-like putative nuclease n=1 Tax=Diaminobutyricimonas sp. TR449 TaxID=2708076 RepID=UPI0014234298|nr:bifunctional RecB family nuclease/DEAD/DEAH box helicase [Diaminobutyricimonas sp. TR449]
MFLLENRVIYSATDLTAASNCEWGLMRVLDAKLGRIPTPPNDEDEMLRRAAVLGDAHEHATLEKLKLTRTFTEFERPGLDGLQEAADATEAALRAGADALFQATFFDGRFVGYADFILRTDDGRYEVYDTKLARRAKITALMQLAAYSDQLSRLDIPTGELVYLLLGDGSTSEHRLRDILPVYRTRRARLQHLLDERQLEAEPAAWGDPRYTACGRCATCAEQVEAHRDLLLVAGMRLTQRTRLHAAGITTIDELAAHTGELEGVVPETLAALTAQARLQVNPDLAYEVFNPNGLSAIPAPDAGDIFFDFEGDPLHHENGQWGLDYLFGLVEPDKTFHAFWAHDLVEEKQALIDFLDWVAERRERHPDMHIYHYAAYERTHLLSLAARHGVGEDAVDGLLRDNVLVDLYPIIRRSVRVGSHSYSLKKLEPLYMGDDEREGVANAADSITEYVRSRDLLAKGQADAAASVLADIGRYNEYDCRSTLALRDWLLARAHEHDVTPFTPVELPLEAPLREPDPVFLALHERLVPAQDRTADDTALALATAAIDYHRREQKTFWWDHFRRLVAPVWEWQNNRGVVVVTDVAVERDWFQDDGQRAVRRILRITGQVAPGSSIGVGDQPFLLYDEPYPPIRRSSEPGARTAHSRTAVHEIIDESVIRLEERLEADAPPYDAIPLALAPGTPPPPGTQVGAISEWGLAVLNALPEPLADPAFDILRRIPGRQPAAAPGHAPEPEAPSIEHIRDALLAPGTSYLAVQGPPGTGKTYTGARVIADLVQNHGWRIGVVAQSHAAVENMLRGVVEAGLDPALVGKKPKASEASTPVPWTSLRNGAIAGFVEQPGFVLGGTAWDFSNAERVPRRHLDLLVIDEAGQFSLASTIAASVAATRLLLLGDPQQLPQVSQGTHPEPVDVSALGWLTDGHDVLPPEFGFFLDTSWRMHPAVCAPVSALSYEGKLHSHSSDRSLDGVPPGLQTVPILHTGNATESIEEADALVEQVRQLLGRDWSEGGVTRPLEQTDLIVVAAYNAQVSRLSQQLRQAGFGQVPVGTVDKFQGREAPVALISLAASSAAEVPRGLEFLLMPNRLNVAISRAQWAAFLFYSPALTEYLPHRVDGLTALSGFITLVGADRDSADQNSADQNSAGQPAAAQSQQLTVSG